MWGPYCALLFVLVKAAYRSGSLFYERPSVRFLFVSEDSLAEKDPGYREDNTLVVPWRNFEYFDIKTSEQAEEALREGRAERTLREGRAGRTLREESAASPAKGSEGYDALVAEYFDKAMEDQDSYCGDASTGENESIDAVGYSEGDYDYEMNVSDDDGNAMTDSDEMAITDDEKNDEMSITDGKKGDKMTSNGEEMSGDNVNCEEMDMSDVEESKRTDDSEDAILNKEIAGSAIDKEITKSIVTENIVDREAESAVASVVSNLVNDVAREYEEIRIPPADFPSPRGFNIKGNMEFLINYLALGGYASCMTPENFCGLLLLADAYSLKPKYLNMLALSLLDYLLTRRFEFENIQQYCVGERNVKVSTRVVKMMVLEYLKREGVGFRICKGVLILDQNKPDDNLDRYVAIKSCYDYWPHSEPECSGAYTDEYLKKMDFDEVCIRGFPKFTFSDKDGELMFSHPKDDCIRSSNTENGNTESGNTVGDTATEKKKHTFSEKTRKSVEHHKRRVFLTLIGMLPSKKHSIPIYSHQYQMSMEDVLQLVRGDNIGGVTSWHWNRYGTFKSLFPRGLRKNIKYLELLNSVSWDFKHQKWGSNNLKEVSVNVMVDLLKTLDLARVRIEVPSVEKNVNFGKILEALGEAEIEVLRVERTDPASLIAVLKSAASCKIQNLVIDYKSDEKYDSIRLHVVYHGLKEALLDIPGLKSLDFRYCKDDFSHKLMASMVSKLSLDALFISFVDGDLDDEKQMAYLRELFEDSTIQKLLILECDREKALKIRRLSCNAINCIRNSKLRKIAIVGCDDKKIQTPIRFY